jgi:Tic22-like family
VIKSLLKLATVIGVVGAIVVAPVATFRAEALTEAQAFERLNSIPVFTITDDKGNPLLGSQKNGGAQQQILLFFLNPDDAKSMLGQIKSTNPELGGKAQVIVRSMNEAIQVIKKNDDKKIAFQIVPSKASIDSARSILSAQGKPVDKLPNLPVFFATGGKDKEQGLLTIEQNGKQLVPFFMDQSDLQAMIDRAKAQQPNMATNTKIQVTSLLQVIDSMVSKDNKANPDAERFTFIPSKAAFQYILANQPKDATPSSQQQLKPRAQNNPSTTTITKPATKPALKPATKPAAKPTTPKP